MRRQLAALINDRTIAQATHVLWEGECRIPGGTDLLVNATPIGLYPDTTARVPVDFDSIEPGTITCDVIPNPPRTSFVREAEARGCTVLDGLGMLVNQGAIAIKLWSGHEPDRGVMRRALREVFSNTVRPGSG